MNKWVSTVDSSLAEWDISIYNCQKLKFNSLKSEIGCKSFYQVRLFKHWNYWSRVVLHHWRFLDQDPIVAYDMLGFFISLLEAWPEVTVRESVVCFLHGNCVAPYKGSFIFKVSVTFSIATQLLKESHEEKRQQKPHCLWMTLNEQNTLMGKFGLLSGTTVVQATALQLQLFALGMLYAHKIHYSVCRVFPA